MIHKTSIHFIFACWCVSAGQVSASGAGMQLCVADFNSSDSKQIATNHDKNVPDASVRIGKNALDDSPCLEFEATLEGSQAGWAGCRLPISIETRTSGTDLLKIDAHAIGRTKGMFITLTESDGSRWNYNVRLRPEWETFELPLHRFTWFTGPSERSQTRPDLSKLVSIDPWVGNPFQGKNGFALDNIRLVDSIAPIRLRLAGNATIALQKATLVTIEAIDAGGNAAPVSGMLWLATMDRTRAMVPEKAPIRDGRATFEVFSRHSGPLDLFAYEPVSGAELRTRLLTDAQGLQMFFNFEPFEGQQMIFANQTIPPHFLLQGEGPLPLSAHVKVRDHVGRVVTAKSFSVAELSATRGKFRLPQPGLFTVDVYALREPLSALPHIPDNIPIRIGDETTVTLPLPDGVTTEAVMGSIVFLEELPSTATIVGRDQFVLSGLVVPPQENAFWKSPFGLCSGALYHLPMEDFPTTGLKRLRLHRRLGSYWGRNDLWWSEMEPQQGSYTWKKVFEVVKYYTGNNVNLMGILGYEPAWSPDKSPAVQEEREAWRKWIKPLFRQFDGRMKAYEVWNEPNHGSWKPAPDVSAYRELLKTTHEELAGMLAESSARGAKPKLGGGVTAGFDPVFLDAVLKDGYKNYLDAISFHPYPENYGASPEENSFGEICMEARQLLKRHQADKEIWLSEAGWPTGPSGVAEKTQANYLVRMYTTALFHRMNKIFWYNLNDSALLPWEKSWDSHLGLFDWNYRPKPAALAYNLMSFMLCRIDPVEYTRQGAAHIYSFRIIPHSHKWSGRLHVAWTEKPEETADVELKAVMNGDFFVFDYLGAERKPELTGEDQHTLEEDDDHEETHDHSEEHDHTDHDTETQSLDEQSTQSVQLHTDDENTTRTYRIRITHEPLYIWDAGKGRKRTAHRH